MNVFHFSESKAFFEISNFIEYPCANKRICFAKAFFSILLALPFALAYKLCKTLFRGLGVLFSACMLAVVFGLSQGLRELFVRRVSALAADLADWILPYPLAVLICLSRLFLASLIHPSLFFHRY